VAPDEQGDYGKRTGVVFFQQKKNLGLALRCEKRSTPGKKGETAAVTT